MKLNNAFCKPWFLLHLLGVLLLGLPTLLLGQEVHNYVFVVEAKPVKRLCKTYNIITVNGQFPGPTLAVREGDSLNIYVVNRARYNITLHWHGIRQLRNGWADGPVYITQCPIQPGGSYTYRFNVEGQRGTLWWHAHSSWLRATVYGALIIYPKLGCSYPFAIPNREAPIILGEWWNRDPIAVVNQANRTGAAPNVSDAFTINGQPGDLYNCSRSGTTIIPVSWGETILLRIINAALNAELFFAIAGHRMTIVAADASYIKPFTTSVLMIAPGQTTDVLLVANQPPARYYMAARAYSPAPNVPFDNTTTTAILQYRNTWYQRGSSIPLPPLFPRLPAYNDTATVTAYSNSHRSLNSERFPAHVPATVDEDLFFTVGLGLFNCSPGRTCGGPNNTRFTASMNNVSFVLPRSLSILQAQQFGVNGVFTANFPPFPPVQFDYTGNVSRALWQPMPGTEALTVRYGSVVQIVLQDTNIFAGENHPIHLHGYSFYVLAEGFGNFDPKSDVSRFNLFDPPKRNTIGVPVKGWTVIRFVADNPGAWLLHCHFDNHLTWGLAMVLLVENGFGELESVKPAPADLPVC